MSHRQRYLFVCTNRRPDDDPRGSCAARGSEALLKKLKAKLAETGGAKAEARVCGSTCIDLCEIGAAMVQEPEHVAYGGVQESDIDDIVKALVDGSVVQRLVKYPKMP